MKTHSLHTVTKLFFGILLVFLCYGVFAQISHAATLRVNPNTGVYTVGAPFTVSVVLNTAGQSVNAADGQLTFNPKEMQVVSVTRTGSIFSLWTEEPTFSNAAGTISFGGGSPAGYKGAAGTVFRITLRALGAGTPKINFKSGSVLAADGLGTNILTSMNGGAYTISAVTNEPEPEYIAPANTPSAPVINSTTHPNPDGWSRETTAVLSWSVPSGITGVRTLLDASPGTVPTIVYDEVISEKTIEDLDDGVSYFHIQFRNSEGWGRITHYRLGVDTEAPKDLQVTVEDSTNPEAPGHLLKVTYDDISPVSEFKVQIDGQDPVTYTDEDGAGNVHIEPLEPGHHTVVVEAFDAAGNSSIASHSFEVSAFEKPVFTEYPTRINTEVIPVIKGTTRPDAEVAVRVVKEGSGAMVFGGAELEFTLKANPAGEFVYIPPDSFEQGVYRISAIARDTSGKLSEESNPIQIIVEIPGYIAFGSIMINVLSILVPLVALLFLLVFGIWYLYHKLAVWRKRVEKETGEAEESLRVEFKNILHNLNKNIATLSSSRKGKLTKAEQALITEIEKDITQAQARITKEVSDIDDVIK